MARAAQGLYVFLHETGRGDAHRFFLSLFYNWLIGNTDGHSKNYGMLLDRPRTRMAPLYDLSSAAPYGRPRAELRPPAMRFAAASPVTLQEWSRTAAQLDLDITTDALYAMAQDLPAALETAATRCPPWAGDTALTVCASIVAHADEAAGATTRALAPSRREPQPGAAMVDAGETCGKTVKRTGKPCLLRADHKGRHRSVL